MKVSAQQIFTAGSELGAPGGLLQQTLAAKYSLRLRRLADKLFEEHTRIQNTRLEIFKKFGEESKPNLWTIKPENEGAAKKEIEGLFAEEIEVGFEKIDLSQLPDLNVSVAGMVALEPFMVFEKEDNKEKDEPKK